MELITYGGFVVLEAIGPFESEEQLVLVGAMMVMTLAGLYLLYSSVGAARLMLSMLFNRPVGAGNVGDAEDGVVEVQGRAEPLERATDGGTDANGPLVYEWRKVQITERVDNDNRDPHNRTREIDSERHMEPFRVVDDTGSVTVDPTGATLSLKERRTTKGGDIQQYRADITPGDTVYVFGEKRTAANDAPGEEPYFVGDGTSVPDFVISDASQFRTVLRKTGKTVGLFVGGLLLLTVASAMFIAEVLGWF